MSKILKIDKKKPENFVLTFEFSVKRIFLASSSSLEQPRTRITLVFEGLNDFLTASESVRMSLERKRNKHSFPSIHCDRLFVIERGDSPACPENRGSQG